MKIHLPHGGKDASFDHEDLVRHLSETGRAHIMQGDRNCLLRDHPKPASLDYWLRTRYTRYKDTKQATNDVSDALVATGRFVKTRRRCPETGRLGKALVLREPQA